MKYNFNIVTFSSFPGRSPFHESLMVGLGVDSPLSTPHELSQQIQSEIAMYSLQENLLLAKSPLVYALKDSPTPDDLVATKLVAIRMSALGLMT